MHHKKPGCAFFMREFPQIIGDAKHGCNTKRGECQLAEFIVPTYPESHTGIEEVMKPEPIADHIDLLVQVHVVMNQQFRYLINDDDNQGQQKKRYILIPFLRSKNRNKPL